MSESGKSAIGEELYTFKLFVGCGPGRKRQPLCNTQCLEPEDQPVFDDAEANMIESKLAAQKKEMSRMALKKRLEELRRNKERLEMMKSKLEGRLESIPTNNSLQPDAHETPAPKPKHDSQFTDFQFIAHFKPRQMGMTIRTDYDTGHHQVDTILPNSQAEQNGVVENDYICEIGADRECCYQLTHEQLIGRIISLGRNGPFQMTLGRTTPSPTRKQHLQFNSLSPPHLLFTTGESAAEIPTEKVPQLEERSKFENENPVDCSGCSSTSEYENSDVDSPIRDDKTSESLMFTENRGQASSDKSPSPTAPSNKKGRPSSPQQLSDH